VYVLPAWAVVLVTLGGAAIGAAAALVGAALTFKSSRLTLQYQADEAAKVRAHEVAVAWRWRRLDAATEFSAHAKDLFVKLSAAIHAARDREADVHVRYAEAVVSLGNALSGQLRTELLFQKLASAELARDVWDSAKECILALGEAKESEVWDDDVRRIALAKKAEELYLKADSELSEFLKEAAKVVEPPDS
jgi:hypothetical protein